MKSPGFTLLEVLISLTIGVMLFSLVLSVYTLANKSLLKGENRSELSQNSRVILERIARDLRQAKDIASPIPPDNTDPDDPPPSAIEIEDGHDSANIRYIHYHREGSNLYREIRRYYFPQSPAIGVYKDSTDDFGNPAAVESIEDQLIGQYVSDLDFYGTDSITIILTLAKFQETHLSQITIYVRNL